MVPEQFILLHAYLKNALELVFTSLERDFSYLIQGFCTLFRFDRGKNGDRIHIYIRSHVILTPNKLKISWYLHELSNGIDTDYNKYENILSMGNLIEMCRRHFYIYSKSKSNKIIKQISHLLVELWRSFLHIYFQVILEKTLKVLVLKNGDFWFPWNFCHIA